MGMAADYQLAHKGVLLYLWLTHPAAGPIDDLVRPFGLSIPHEPGTEGCPSFMFSQSARRSEQGLDCGFGYPPSYSRPTG
jgi:hypothetical protein